MKKFLSLAAIAAAMLSVASCSNSAMSEMKKATADFDLTYLPYFGLAGGPPSVKYQNPDGEIIFEHELPGRRYSLFHEGYACVNLDKTIAIINREGETVVELTGFSYAYHETSTPGCVSENRFIAQREFSNSFVCFDMEGNEIFEAEGIIMSQLRAGYALYALSARNSKLGVINAQGEVVFEAGQDEYIPKRYSMGNPANYAHPTWFPVFNDDGFAYILDVATGKHYLEDISIDYKVYPFTGVDCNDRIIVYSNDDFGLIDMEGNTIIEPQYSYLKNDGEWYSFQDENNKYGWLDKNGEIVIEPQFDGFHGDELVYFGTSDWAPVDPHTFINRKGEVVLESEYTIDSGFIGDRYMVDLGRAGYAWMDREGNITPINIDDLTRNDIRALARGEAIQY